MSVRTTSLTKKRPGSGRSLTGPVPPAGPPGRAKVPAGPPAVPSRFLHSFLSPVYPQLLQHLPTGNKPGHPCLLLFPAQPLHQPVIGAPVHSFGLAWRYRVLPVSHSGVFVSQLPPDLHNSVLRHGQPIMAVIAGPI